MEIGSPMASMYILGNPDHYKSHVYVNFAWRSYVSFVKNFWSAEQLKEEDEGMNCTSKTLFASAEDDPEDKITIKTLNGKVVASSVVDDYRFRPVVYEKLNLYEWVQTSDKKVRTRKEQ
ncbi:hypothetical protein C8R43DRAFT_842620, partial [Mycena crocata]